MSKFSLLLKNTLLFNIVFFSFAITAQEIEEVVVTATKKEESEDEKGLGLNICVAILEEHGFKLTCEKIDTGTKMKIKINISEFNVLLNENATLLPGN